MSPAYLLRTVVSEPFAENTYILWKPGRADALVVDPGFDVETVQQFLVEEGLTPAALLNTHGHVDHIAGNADLKRAYPKAPLIIGSGDALMLTDPYENLSALAGADILSPPADRLVNDGNVLELAGFTLEVRDLPGHSAGHVVFLALHEPTPFVLGGDVLFRGSIGRSDFPGGDQERLLRGVREVLWPLPPETVVYPGHGPATTVGHEKKTNPFF